MKITDLKTRPDIIQIRVNREYEQLALLLSELKTKELPEGMIRFINVEVEGLNYNPNSGKKLRKQMVRKQQKIIKVLEKELNLVPKNYYQNHWMALGMVVFGIPLGTAFGTGTGNISFLGVGLPLGLVIGMLIGSGLDKKAKKENRQLDFELKN